MTAGPSAPAVIMHHDRHMIRRIGLAAGEARYDDLEKRGAEGPVINVPAITLEGDVNEAPHADAASYRKKFSGKYAYRLITGGAGHDLPQEAPRPLPKP